MYDKKFSRDRRMVNTSYNWKINLLFHNEDLMDSLNNSVTALRDKDERNVNNVTMMSSIINLLRVRGITKVIIIDLSCSVIRNGKSEVTPRTERHQLFDHLKKGGITKKRYKTMKCRKYNKRIRYRKKTKKITSIHSPLTSCSSSVGLLTPLETPRSFSVSCGRCSKRQRRICFHLHLAFSPPSRPWASTGTTSTWPRRTRTPNGFRAPTLCFTTRLQRAARFTRNTCVSTRSCSSWRRTCARSVAGGSRRF